MKETIKTAIIELQKSPDPTKAVKFSYQSKKPKKSVTASVVYQGTGKPTLSISEIKGYNEKYITGKINSHLNAIMNGALPNPVKGSRIYTKTPPSPAGSFILVAGTDYYAVDDSIIVCTPQQLNADFKAEYIRDDNAMCIGGGVIISYNIFHLL